MIKNILVYRTKHMGKTVDYSSMVGMVFSVFKETKSTYILYSNTKYKFVTTVNKRDCRVTTEPTINYEWKNL